MLACAPSEIRRPRKSVGNRGARSPAAAPAAAASLAASGGGGGIEGEGAGAAAGARSGSGRDSVGSSAPGFRTSPSEVKCRRSLTVKGFFSSLMPLGLDARLLVRSPGRPSRTQEACSGSPVSVGC